jgi:BCCT family betaine/carnitine transporter
MIAIWMNAFGGTALSQYLDSGHRDVIAAVQAQQPEIALFMLLETLPLVNVTSFIGLVLVVVFFVTSSDSGSLVVDTITAGGKEDVPTSQRVFWATLEGVVAAVLLLVGGTGALDALRAMTVSTGLPFTLVLLAMCYSIWVGLWAAVRERRGV